jgi:hypothetical protein
MAIPRSWRIPGASPTGQADGGGDVDTMTRRITSRATPGAIVPRNPCMSGAEDSGGIHDDEAVELVRPDGTAGHRVGDVGCGVAGRASRPPLHPAGEPGLT